MFLNLYMHYVSVYNSNPLNLKVSWCAQCLTVDGYEKISALDHNAYGDGSLPINAFGVMAINFLTSVNKQGDLEIVAVSCKGSTKGGDC